MTHLSDLIAPRLWTLNYCTRGALQELKLQGNWRCQTWKCSATNQTAAFDASEVRDGSGSKALFLHFLSALTLSSWNRKMSSPSCNSCIVWNTVIWKKCTFNAVALRSTSMWTGGQEHVVYPDDLIWKNFQLWDGGWPDLQYQINCLTNWAFNSPICKIVD